MAETRRKFDADSGSARSGWTTDAGMRATRHHGHAAADSVDIDPGPGTLPGSDQPVIIMRVTVGVRGRIKPHGRDLRLRRPRAWLVRRIPWSEHDDRCPRGEPTHNPMRLGRCVHGLSWTARPSAS